jgi:hypothetical protein
MVANVITCPSCRKHLKVRGSIPANLRVSCPACGRQILPDADGHAVAVAIPVTAPSKPWKVVQLALAAAILFVGIEIGGMFYRANGAEKAPVPVPVAAQVAAPLTAPVAVANPAPSAPAASQVVALPVQAPAAPVTPPPPPPPAPVAAVPTSPLPQIGLPNVPQIITNPQVGYTTLMNDASVAMMDGRLADARTLYLEALQVAPNLSRAPTAVWPPRPDNCRTAWIAPPAPTADPNQVALDGIRQATYQTAMARADADMRAQNYTAAVKDYQAALNAKPGDQIASFAMFQAEGLGL